MASELFIFNSVLSKDPDLIFGVKVTKMISDSKYQVFVAESRENQKLYALKLFPIQQDLKDPCFQRESVLMTLDHPHIAKAWEIGDVNLSSTTQSQYIMTEFYNKKDLGELLQSGKFPKDEIVARTYFHQLVDAIEYLHNNGIAHMDIKPDNILLDEEYQMKLIDFDSSILTLNHQKMLRHGTPNYRAPEVKSLQLRDPKAADIYSLGITLFLMLVGMFPYQEASEGSDFERKFIKGKKDYWKEHPSKDFWTDERKNLKKLIMQMVDEKPFYRLKIQEIKENKWFSGPTYSRDHLALIMNVHFQKDQ